MFPAVRRMSTYYRDSRNKFFSRNRVFTTNNIKNCHAFAYLLTYLMYIAINVFTIFHLTRNRTKLHTHQDTLIHEFKRVFLDSIILWNVIHTLSLFPDLWAGTDSARICRTSCTLISAVLQTVFWTVIFPNIFDASLFILEYGGCCVMFLCELVYRIAYTRWSARRAMRVILPDASPNVQVNIQNVGLQSAAV